LNASCDHPPFRAVIPVILRPTLWQNAPFGALQALPANAIPVTDRSWHTQDEAFLNIAEGIVKVIEDFSPFPPGRQGGPQKRQESFQKKSSLSKTQLPSHTQPVRFVSYPGSDTALGIN
jgi:hypothetical protein